MPVQVAKGKELKMYFGNGTERHDYGRRTG